MSKTLEDTYIRIKLDGGTFDTYQDQANQSGRSIEGLITQRLQEVKGQNSYDGRTIVINPADRQRLEVTCGRAFGDGTEMVNYLVNAHSVQLNDIKVEINAELLRRLRARCGRNDWDTFIAVTLIDCLERFVGMR